MAEELEQVGRKTAVFIVDDHAIVREGVRRIVAGCTDMTVVDEAASGPEAILKILKTECDVVLLDLALPGMDGLEVLRAVKEKKPNLPVLILSIYPEEDYAFRAYKDGASGYLTKESLPSELIDAIRKVARGKRYLSDSFGERLMSEMTGTGRKLPHEHLSTREYQIFRMIVSGKSLKEMAQELSLAPTTISSYRGRILEKMSAKTNMDLARYAVDHHILD
jgi:two-component system, NarL family, invasion response regulator UvrY